MAINYVVRPNDLTSPPSYRCQVEPQQVLDYDQIAELINLNDPTIPVAVAKSCLLNMRERIKEQILDGNTILLTGFFSMVPSMKVRLDIPTDPLPSDPKRVDIRFKPAKPFKDEVRDLATFNRMGYPTKNPEIVVAYETNYTAQQWARPGYGLKIEGMNLGFNPANADEGIFATSPGANVIQQVNLTQNDPSQLTCVFEADATDAPNMVEYTLAVKSRYTVNGTLREGVFGKKIRKTNDITAANPAFFETGTYTGVAFVSIFGGAGVTSKIVAERKPDGRIIMKVAGIAGAWGPEVEITGVGVYDLGFTLQITVVNFTKLEGVLDDYGNYITEYCVLNTIP